MDQNHFTTDTLRKKGAHLTFEERVMIQTRLRDKQSYRSIAREIGCCVNTVRNEVKRGKVLCYNGKVERYRAADGQSTYEAHRENCGRKCDAVAKGAFLDYVQKRLQEHSLIRKLPNKESASVIAAFRKLKDGMFRDCFSECSSALRQTMAVSFLACRS